MGGVERVLCLEKSILLLRFWSSSWSFRQQRFAREKGELNTLKDNLKEEKSPTAKTKAK